MQGQQIERFRTESGWSFRCAHCGTVTESRRSDATFCSPKCRKAHERAQSDFRRQLADLRWAVPDIANKIDKYGCDEQVRQLLIDLKAEITIALSRYTPAKLD